MRGSVKWAWRRSGRRTAAFLIALLACTPLAAANERIGTTLSTQGVSTASLAGDIRLMGHGTPIYRNDVLTTGKDSFALVEFSDGARLALRPGTVFRIDEYADGEEDERMRLRLFQGGMRAISGQIATRTPDAFELRTPAAVLKVSGTDFSARLCERDCQEEAEDSAEAGVGRRAVGRVAFVKGEVVAVSPSGRERGLRAGKAVFQGDALETGPGAFAVVAFRDESRITLLENTRFRVDRHEYDPETPSSSNALMRLIRGGIRVAAGLISQVRPQAYRIATLVATISTRGTRFDLVCSGTCLGGEVPQADPNGLFLLVRSGRIAVESSAGTFEFDAGMTAFVGSSRVAPRLDVPLPSAVDLLLRSAPAPEDVEVPPDLLRDSVREVREGDLVVAVYDGEVHAVSTEEGATEAIELGEGDAALLGEAGATELEDGAPAFVTDDPYNFSPDVEVGEDGTIDGGLLTPSEEDSMLCRM